jgi:hypothetical protein
MSKHGDISSTDTRPVEAARNPPLTTTERLARAERPVRAETLRGRRPCAVGAPCADGDLARVERLVPSECLADGDLAPAERFETTMHVKSDAWRRRLFG